MITPNSFAWSVIERLSDGVGRTGRELAEALDAEPNSTTATMSKLRRLGLAETAPDTEETGGNGRPVNIWQISEAGRALLASAPAEETTEPAEATAEEDQAAEPAAAVLRARPRKPARGVTAPPVPAPIDDDMAAALAELARERERAERALAASAEPEDPGDTTVRVEINRGGSIFSYNAAIPRGHASLSDLITEYQTVHRMTERLTRDALHAAYPVLHGLDLPADILPTTNGANHG